jgi:DNA-directed RNA polymerase specialized sigma24 family protein
MDEVQELCRRVLGPGASADEAAAQARTDPARDRLALLAAAAAACRERSEQHDGDPRIVEQPGAGTPGLAEAVAHELALATARLPERQREALALRELLRLSHEQISNVMGIEPASVAPLLARARLRLRSERRGTEPEPARPTGLAEPGVGADAAR